MKHFLLSCFALSAVVAQAQDAGVCVNNSTSVPDGSAEGRIINGQLAASGNFPWQVGIFHTVGNSQQFCGGALISSQWILTAAHCVYNAHSLSVILGATRAYDPQKGKITMNVESALYHPQYNPNTLNNDVAVVKMVSPVRFTKTIRSIGLARSNSYLQAGVPVRVSGWGKTSDRQNSIVNKLSWVTLNTISNQQCKQYFQASLVQDNVVCCDGSQTKSTCNGDSGGPLIQRINNQWIHVGVVSFVSTKGCAVGAPSGFARTASHIGFINANTGLGFA